MFIQALNHITLQQAKIPSARYLNASFIRKSTVKPMFSKLHDSIMNLISFIRPSLTDSHKAFLNFEDLVPDCSKSACYT